jgi:6,7-dimethyl-8-ribityllumazine synthase
MKKKICIVIADYYPKITNDLLKGAKKKLKDAGIIKFKKLLVPGVFEIPVIIAKYVNKFDGFIALGCVIKGETPHFDFICNASINALMNLSINYKKPIGNGIITCLNKKQAITRSNPKIKDKGGEAANAVISILNT